MITLISRVVRHTFTNTYNLQFISTYCHLSLYNSRCSGQFWSQILLQLGGAHPQSWSDVPGTGRQPSHVFATSDESIHRHFCLQCRVYQHCMFHSYSFHYFKSLCQRWIVLKVAISDVTLCNNTFNWAILTSQWYYSSSQISKWQNKLQQDMKLNNNNNNNNNNNEQATDLN